MTKKGDYEIGNIYQGGYSSLNPSYGSIFTGYHVSAGELGAPTKPDTANQIQQVNLLLNQGIIPIEVGALQPETFDQIPKQHFREINRMAKLTGAKISLHAPLIEPSGIDGEQRRPWDESYRELAEKQLSDVVKRSMELSDKESIPITIHSSNIPGTEYKIVDGKKVMDRMVAINRESGKMVPLEEERLYYPDMPILKPEIEKMLKTEKDERALSKKFSSGEIKRADIYGQIPLEEGKLKTPQSRLLNINLTEWDNSISQVLFNKERADEILQQNTELLKPLMQNGKLQFNEEIIKKSPQLWNAYSHLQNAEAYLDDTNQHVQGIFHKAYKYGSEKQKKELAKLATKFRDDLTKDESPFGQSNALQSLIHQLKKQEFAPNMYVPIEDFAVDNSSKTFANVAFEAYQEAKKENKPIPIINIENLYPGMTFSSGEQMSKLILESRKKFVEKAKSKGMSESEAKKQAEKIIGMTLDVGHLNIYKKKGFEDKDLIKEVKQIAKYVKHIHLTDNFGYSDSHLPPGMGNVPFKEILKKLEKEGDIEGVRKIVEAGGWVQHFQTSPLSYTLEGMGSPVYSEGVGPYWNQAIGLQQGYFGGGGMFLPNINYETFGAGFSQLPVELGGQRGGAQGSRMSGRGME